MESPAGQGSARARRSHSDRRAAVDPNQWPLIAGCAQGTDERYVLETPARPAFLPVLSFIAKLHSPFRADLGACSRTSGDNSIAKRTQASHSDPTDQADLTHHPG